jgi:hypothetical protein
MDEIMRRIVEIPWARLVYSGVLLGIASMLMVEVVRTWQSQGVAVGTFTYYSDGVAKPELGVAFAAQTVAIHRLMLLELEDEEKVRRQEAEAARDSQILAWWPGGRLPLVQSSKLLADLELKVQGFDVGGLLKWLRTWVRPANEIRGTVDHTTGLMRASVSWGAGPARVAGGDKIELKYFSTRPVADDQSLAMEVAGSLIWAEAARADDEISRIAREEFVGWARAFQSYRQLKLRRGAGIPVGEEDTKLLKSVRDLLDPLIAGGPTFPEIFRLRADVIRVSSTSTPDELQIAEEDRRKYLALVGVKATGTPAPVTIATEESAVEPAIVPGLAVTVHGAFDWGGRITAIVVDAQKQEFAVLPAIQDAERSQYLSRDGTASTAFADLDRVVRLDQTRPDETGIALFRLRSEVVARNIVDATALTTLGEPPKLGDRVTLLRPDRRESAEIATTEALVPAISRTGRLVTTNRRITVAGDAGAPIINAGGSLVAMAIGGGPTGSILLPVKALLESLQMTLKGSGS